MSVSGGVESAPILSPSSFLVATEAEPQTQTAVFKRTRNGFPGPHLDLKIAFTLDQMYWTLRAKCLKSRGTVQMRNCTRVLEGKNHLSHIAQPKQEFECRLCKLIPLPSLKSTSIISSSLEVFLSHSPFLIISVHPLVKSSPVPVQISSAESCARFSPDKVWILSASDWQAGIHHAGVSHTIKENVSLILQNVIYLAPSWPDTVTNHTFVLFLRSVYFS